MAIVVEGSASSSRRLRRFGFARLLDLAVGLAALVALALTLAEVCAPRYAARIEVADVGTEGGHAFSFGLPWEPSLLYVVPSHPDFVLSPGDVEVTEDGRSIGILQPDHAVIRHDGGGLFNLWQGTLWFSPSDDTDPRSNGRTYDVTVRSRLAPWAVTARWWSWAGLAVLLLCRFGPAATRGTVRAGAFLDRRLGLGRLVERIPLSFGRLFALAGATALGLVAFGFLHRPMPLVLEADSLGYIGPGLVWASGGDMTGQSVRDLGYPFVTLVAARLGSLSILPKLQLAMVIAGLACLLATLFLGLVRLAARLRAQSSVPGWVLAAIGAVAALAYVALLSGHDLFMLDVYSAMAEAPHLLPCALALLLFIGALVTTDMRARIAMLSLASLAAYASAMFKPHSLLVLALCLASAVISAAAHRRSLASPVVVAVCAVCLICATAVYRFDAKVTPLTQDFGPKTLFCNHLDVIGPVLDIGTPQRRRIAALLHDVLARTEGWPIMGFNGDGCMYGADFNAALVAVSASEGTTPAKWEKRQFVEAVLRNPVGYGRAVARQLWAYLADPTNGMDSALQGNLTDQDWEALERSAKADILPTDHSHQRLDNWVPRAHPQFGAAVKAALVIVRDLYAPVTLGSTLLAFVTLFRFRRRTDPRCEVVLLGTAGFTLAFAATTVLAHTFDVARYAADLLPFSLLWWMLGVAYLGHLTVLAGTTVWRKVSTHPTIETVPTASHRS